MPDIRPTVLSAPAPRAPPPAPRRVPRAHRRTPGPWARFAGPLRAGQLQQGLRPQPTLSTAGRRSGFPPGPPLPVPPIRRCATHRIAQPSPPPPGWAPLASPCAVASPHVVRRALTPIILCLHSGPEILPNANFIPGSWSHLEGRSGADRGRGRPRLPRPLSKPPTPGPPFR